MVVKSKQISYFGGQLNKYGVLNQTDFMNSVVSQKSMVVKTKQISWFRWLVKKSMVVKTKQISWFRWLVKKVGWLKQNRFRDFGG